MRPRLNCMTINWCRNINRPYYRCAQDWMYDHQLSRQVPGDLINHMFGYLCSMRPFSVSGLKKKGKGSCLDSFWKIKQLWRIPNFHQSQTVRYKIRQYSVVWLWIMGHFQGYGRSITWPKLLREPELTNWILGPHSSPACWRDPIKIIHSMYQSMERENLKSSEFCSWSTLNFY